MKNHVKKLKEFTPLFVFLAIAAAYLYFTNPYRAFKDRLGFKLPGSAKVMESKVHMSLEKAFDAKIRFDEKDYEYVIDNTWAFASTCGIEEYRGYFLHAFPPVAEEDVIVYYHLMMAGHFAKTRMATICITQEDGVYYLYLEY